MSRDGSSDSGSATVAVVALLAVAITVGLAIAAAAGIAADRVDARAAVHRDFVFRAGSSTSAMARENSSHSARFAFNSARPLAVMT